MRASHSAQAAKVEFDDPNLLADGGLAQVMGLAEKIDLARLGAAVWARFATVHPTFAPVRERMMSRTA
jgi:hypothetical protein